MSLKYIKGFRLSAQQKHLWLLQKKDEFYRARLSVNVRGAIDRQRFEAAVKKLSERHEILRTMFHQLAGMKIPVQVIAEDVDIASNLLKISSKEKLFSVSGELPYEEYISSTEFELPALNRIFLLDISPQETIVVFDLPALCADAETLKNIYSELTAIYASIGDESEHIEPEPIQYVQFSEWQSEILSEDIAKNTFRNKSISDHLWLAKLPFEKKPDEKAAFAPRHISVELTNEIINSVRIFCGGRKIKMQSFFLSCWAGALARWTGQTSILTGAEFNGRVSEELEKALGLYAQYIPLVFEFQNAASFDRTLDQVEREVQEIMTHQEYFSRDSLDNLQTESVAAQTGFIPHLFDFVELPEKANAAGVEFSVEQLSVCRDRFKLKLSVFQHAEKIDFQLHFDPEYFSDEAARRLLGQLCELVKNAEKEPAKPLSSLIMTDVSEKHLLITDFNQTAKNYSVDECLHNLIERQSESQPDAAAVVCGLERLTYGELNERADQLAKYLRFLGVKAEIPVVLCLERSVEVLIGLLGILKAGGVYVPFNPAYPREQMAFMLRDSKAAVVLTHSSLLEKMPETNAQVICPDTDWNKIASERRMPPVSEINPANAAYIIYTSGSTGQPKGVVISHRNAVHSTRARFDYYQKTVESYLLISPFAFDSSVAGIFWTLAQGGTLVLPPENFQQNLSALLEIIESQRISHLLAPPSLYSVLLEAAAPEQLETLHTVIIAGEAGTLELLNRHRKKLENTALFNEYGPTENTVWSSVDELTAHDSEFISIGRPITDSQIYLLDSQMNPVPHGAGGELYLGGSGIARGYLNRPDFTAEKFVPDLFGGKSGARLYRSGDLARYDLDGRLEFLGRIDNQVKIRGFRIELEEIEVRLTQHPAVGQAAVIVHKSASGENARLIAYIAPIKNAPIDSNELRNFLARILPEQMIPANFFILDSLPLTYNGKIDRRALPTPESLTSGRRESFTAPRTIAEKKLAEIWAQVLGVEQVGITDNFFDLGGDSIRSLQVVSRAAACGINFSVQQLIRHPNIRELISITRTSARNSPPAQNISAAFGLISDADRQKISADIEDAYPLTMLQAGMLFHGELGGKEAAVYHDVMSFRVRAAFDEKKLRDALNELSARHPMIRTSFDFTNFSQPLQLVHRKAEIPLLAADLRDLTAQEQEIVLAAWQTEEKRQGFDLEKSPLLRFAVHRLDDGNLQISYSCHHAILDGWSAATMLTELFQLYLNQELSDLPVAAFRDFVALERESLASEASRAYWAENIAGNHSTSLLGSTISTDKNASQIQNRNVELPPEVLPSLRELAQKTDVPLKNVLLSAHLKVLSLFTGQTEITTGLVSHGREELNEGERILGLFLNTVPFCVRLENETWSELSRRVFAREQDIFPHRLYPLAEIQRRFNHGATLIDTGFNFIHFHVFDPLLGLKEVEYLGGDFSTRTNLALLANFILDPNSDQLSLQLELDQAQLGETSFEDLADYYSDVLQKMINEPDARHTAYTVSAAQLKQLRKWNDTEKSYDLNNCLHYLFEEQAARTPDAAAIVFAGEHLTYRELNERSNRLAHYLIKQGGAPEELIAVCMERSLEMFVALIAILKTGAAYVPIDPAYPQERRTFMLNDARARLILTQDHLAESLPNTGAQIVRIDKERSSINQESSSNPAKRATAQNLAYMIYTSGSTGQPKGAMNTHGGIVNRLLWMQDAYRLTSEDCVLHKTPLSFDVSVWELFWALIVGARIAVAKPGGHRDSGYLTDLIRRERVTTAHFVPAMLRVFLEEENVPECRSLNRVICSGEALTADSIERFFALLEQSELHNLYGPTEAAVDVTAWKCRLSLGSANVPIGKPISNTQIYILNSNLLPVPIEVGGEIWIGGVAVGRGYHCRADLTAERFIPDPFSNKSGVRMYRTGDLGRFTKTGEIEFLGRLDQQVKLRGFRIEPGEIESVIRQSEGVRDVSVMLRGENKNARLIAYVVPFEKKSETDELQRKLEEDLKLTLPDYMQPSRFVWLDEMPLLPNGKINRQGLLLPDTLQTQTQPAFVAPQTPAEQFIAQLLAEALKIDRIGLDDDFLRSADTR